MGGGLFTLSTLLSFWCKTFDFILKTVASRAFFCETLFWVWNDGTWLHSYVICGWPVLATKFSFSQNTLNWCTRRSRKSGDEPPIRLGSISKKTRRGQKYPSPSRARANFIAHRIVRHKKSVQHGRPKDHLWVGSRIYHLCFLTWTRPWFFRYTNSICGRLINYAWNDVRHVEIGS